MDRSACVKILCSHFAVGTVGARLKGVHVADPDDAVRRFAETLDHLRRLAQTSGPQIARQAEAQVPPIKISPSVLSAWLRGIHVPSDRKTLKFLVSYLESKVGASYQPLGEEAWENLYDQARRAKDANRGGRPTKRHRTFPAGQVNIKVIRPAALRPGARISYNELVEWLKAPIEQGRQPGSRAYPLVGMVDPPIAGGSVTIRLHTNTRYPQGRFDLDDAGQFTGQVFLDDRHPPTTFDLTVLDQHDMPVAQAQMKLA